MGIDPSLGPRSKHITSFPNGLSTYLQDHDVPHNKSFHIKKVKPLIHLDNAEIPTPYSSKSELEQVLSLLEIECLDEKLKKKLINQKKEGKRFDSDSFCQFDPFFQYLLYRSYGLTISHPTEKEFYEQLENVLPQLDHKKNFLETILGFFQNNPSSLTEFRRLLDPSYYLVEETKETYHQTINRLNIVLNDLKQEESQFLRKIDLFSLVSFLFENYQKKVKEYNDFRISSDIRDRTLTASFNENFLDNTFNDFDQYKSLTGAEICIFNYGKYSHASLLHSAHPDIHYLTITSTDLNDFDPLAIAILMVPSAGYNIDSEGAPIKNESFHDDYLIVEGVLSNFNTGNGWDEPHRKAAYHSIWDAIKLYAYQERKDRIFINTSHSGNQQEVEEFIEYVAFVETQEHGAKIKYNFENDKKMKTKKFRLHEPQECYRPEYGEWFSHYFSFPEDLSFAHRVSNKEIYKKKARLLYKGEQFSDTFFKTHSFGGTQCPFVSLKGYAQGFEIDLKEYTLNHYEKDELSDRLLELSPEILEKLMIGLE